MLELTPGAVATTLYGARYNSRPVCSNMFLNKLMTCNANMSCLTSSPTYKHNIRQELGLTVL